MTENYTIPAEKKESIAGNIAVSVFSLIFGSFLCLTGIGAIIGAPLIIASFVLPFSRIGAIELNGECPYCKESFMVTIDRNGKINSSSKKGKTCKHCKKRVIIKDKKFYALD
jgi:hypothetical protein